MSWADYVKPLSEGAWVTIQLAVLSTIVGAICAFAAGIGRIAANPVIRGVSIVYIEVFRGTSLLVQLFWLYFARSASTCACRRSSPACWRSASISARTAPKWCAAPSRRCGRPSTRRRRR
jgi:His/Glu/Gln/Arg/opine family amino acid ABC transporter permease subunit